MPHCRSRAAFAPLVTLLLLTPLTACEPEGAEQPNLPRSSASETPLAASTGASTAEGSTPTVPRRDGTIRIATYNILNLFDEHDDPALEGREEDLFSSWDGIRAKPASQQEGVAKAIRAIDADVLCLQEIESKDALVEFRDKYLAGMGYDYVASEDIGAERGIEQSVLSRFPLEGPEFWDNMPLGGTHPELYGSEPNRYAGEPITCRRSPVKVTVNVPGEDGAEGYDLTLLVVHHKSGRFNNYWRERESVKFVELIEEIEASNPNANVAILGDFNAQPDEVSMQTYFTSGLTDVCTIGIDLSESYTHESGRTIDFILVNDNLKAEVIEGSAVIFDTPMRPVGADWRNTPAPEGFAADHKPVLIDITPRDAE